MYHYITISVYVNECVAYINYLLPVNRYPPPFGTIPTPAGGGGGVNGGGWLSLKARC